MPPGRPTAARQRLVAQENDENSTSTRLTRAKAAALIVDELSMPSKTALQTKKTTTNATNAAGTRRRAALGDVSNVGKNDVVEGKKPAAGKASLVSKTAQPSRVQKSTRPSSRVALAAKENKPAVEPKRNGSGSGTIKRKNVSTSNNREDSVTTDEAEVTRKKTHGPDSEKRQKIEKAELAPVEARPIPEGVLIKDGEDVDDPLMVAEYATEIFEYLRDLEVSSVPNPQYMYHQDDLEWKTRGILIDWLIEVHTRFHLLPETLFLAINIIDRFLSEKVVQLDRLQLVGITAMFIASKYEEVLSPHVENFKRITDDGFSEAEILSAERFILSTLNYDLSYPNPMNFLRRVSKADDYDIQTRTVGKYLMEISLLDHRFLAYRPSHVAAGAMYLARLMLDRGEWDETLAYYAGYTEMEVEPVVHLMVDYLARPVCHEAFFKKYASKKFLKASILARTWAKKSAAAFGLTDLDLSLDQIS
uniref:Cyclin N-terminal domain-containing protein n=1 Tax=Bionectria ochroleuca TaxID=29856 RepID=A0A8H7NCP6_BIOOC